jgi:hypothetical protein
MVISTKGGSRDFHNGTFTTGFKTTYGTSTTIFTGKSTVVEVPLFSSWKFLVLKRQSSKSYPINAKNGNSSGKKASVGNAV